MNDAQTLLNMQEAILNLRSAARELDAAAQLCQGEIRLERETAQVLRSIEQAKTWLHDAIYQAEHVLDQ